MSQILDGKGKGYRAEVDSQHRLKTSATMTTQERFVSAEKEDAFFLSTAQGGILSGLPAGVGFDGAILLLQNQNPTQRLSVQKIFLSGNDSGSIFSFIKNPVIGTLADYTQVTPENLNFSSGKSPLVNAYVWDGVGVAGIGGLTVPKYFNQYINGNNPIIAPIDGSFVIGSGDILGINLLANAGGIAHAAFRFFFEEV